MPIRKRGNRWHIRLQIGGQRIERTLGPSAGAEDAKAYEAKIRADILAGRLGKTPARSLDEALARWLDGEAAALHDLEGYKSKVRSIRGLCEGRSLDQVVEVAQAVKDAGIKARLKPGTINRRLAVLRRVANLAYQSWGWLDRPLGQRIKLMGGERPRMERLSPAQADLLLDAVADRSRPAIMLYLLTGLRESELLRLDPARQLVDGMLVLDANNKTGRPRLVPLTEEAQALMAAWRPGELTYAMLRYDFEAARAKVDMGWLQLRDLRRTFASWIVQRTQSLKVAQDLLGHTSPAITGRHYAYLLNAQLTGAVAQLPVLGKSTGQKRGNETGEPSKEAA